jgi:hypothetical protein
MSAPAIYCSNDDALVDCMEYAWEMRRCGRDVEVHGSRTIVDCAVSRECAINMCDNDGCRLIRVCENGHAMHDACLEDLVRKCSSIKELKCPACRSDRMKTIVLKAENIEPTVLMGVASPRTAALKALCCATREWPKLSAQSAM